MAGGGGGRLEAPRTRQIAHMEAPSESSPPAPASPPALPSEAIGEDGTAKEASVAAVGRCSTFFNAASSRLQGHRRRGTVSAWRRHRGRWPGNWSIGTCKPCVTASGTWQGPGATPAAEAAPRGCPHHRRFGTSHAARRGPAAPHHTTTPPHRHTATPPHRSGQVLRTLGCCGATRGS